MLPVKKEFDLGIGFLDPFRSLKRMHEDVDSLFASLWPRGDHNLLEPAGWAPAVDLYEEKDRFVLKMDVPGVRKEDLSLSLSEGILTLRGERKEENEVKKENTYRHETVSGSFHRAVRIPGAVKAGSVTAEYADGVLKVFLPKAEEAKAKEIRIKVK